MVPRRHTDPSTKQRKEEGTNSEKGNEYRGSKTENSSTENYSPRNRKTISWEYKPCTSVHFIIHTIHYYVHIGQNVLSKEGHVANYDNWADRLNCKTNDRTTKVHPTAFSLSGKKNHWPSCLQDSRYTLPARMQPTIWRWTKLRRGAIRNWQNRAMRTPVPSKWLSVQQNQQRKPSNLLHNFPRRI